MPEGVAAGCPKGAKPGPCARYDFRWVFMCTVRRRNLHPTPISTLTVIVPHFCSHGELKKSTKYFKEEDVYSTAER